MVILWFAGAALVLVLVLWVLALAVLKTRGGRVEVDNERDINDHFFADVLRLLLKPAVAPEWGQAHPDNPVWRYGKIHMRRKDEVVGVHEGSLRLGKLPRKVAALVVTGDLGIVQDTELDCDIWCLGDVSVGARCRLRSLAAEGSIRIGQGAVFQRWVDAGRSLEIGADVTMVAQASAGEAVTVHEGVQGGKIFGAVIRIVHEEAAVLPDREALARKAERWKAVRASRDDLAGCDPTVRQEQQWTLTESTTTAGRFWAGPRTVLLHDLVVRDSAVIGDECIVVGSINTEKELLIGRGTLVTGNISCGHLTLEEGAAVGGSIHADGDVILHDGTVIGLSPEAGGLVATGSVQFGVHVEITRRIIAGETLAYWTRRRRRVPWTIRCILAGGRHGGRPAVGAEQRPGTTPGRRDHHPG